MQFHMYVIEFFCRIQRCTFPVWTATHSIEYCKQAVPASIGGCKTKGIIVGTAFFFIMGTDQKIIFIVFMSGSLMCFPGSRKKKVYNLAYKIKAPPIINAYVSSYIKRYVLDQLSNDPFSKDFQNIIVIHEKKFS